MVPADATEFASSTPKTAGFALKEARINDAAGLDPAEFRQVMKPRFG
jgi:hypothetical protein